MDDPRIGSVLDGRYRIIARLAAGGMGVVYRAERVQLGRVVAIKFLHAGVAANENARRRFEVEARAMGRLQHPHCAAVIDFGIDRDCPYVVMDFVEGVTLRQVLEEHGRLPARRAFSIVRQMLAGLAYAHGEGITHRDIKPPNVMVSQTTGVGDLVRILDFGLAKLGEGAGGLTAGFVVGTPAYMAPEQTLSEPVDARTDVYAAGVVLFELLTGRLPYRSDDPLVVMKMHREAPVPRLADLAPGDPRLAELDAVLARALAKNPADRFASAAEFTAALSRLADDLVVPELPEGGAPATFPSTAALARGHAPADTQRELGTMPTAMMLIAPALPGAAAGASPAGGGAPTVELDATVNGRPARVASPHRLEPATVSAPRRGRRWVPISLVVGAGGAIVAAALLLSEGGPSQASASAEVAPVLAPADADEDVPAAPAGEASAGGAAAAAPDEPEHDRDDDVGTDAVAQAELAAPAPPTSTIPELTRLRDLVESGNGARAIKPLIKLEKAHPKEAEISYLLSRAYFGRMWFSDGIQSARAAIAKNPAYKSDPELIKSALVGFLSPQNSSRVGRFLRHDIGPAAIPYLDEMAKDHPNPRVRERAARARRAFPSK